jgi:hypothetical protein
MQASVMFVNCPAYLDNSGPVRCGLPAEVEGRYTMRSADGPLESARIRCPPGRWFNGPVDSLTLPQQSRGRDDGRAEGQAGLPDHGDHGGPGGGSWRAPAEFVPRTRLGWYGTGDQLRAYHTRLLIPREAGGTYVVMEEKGMGHAARHLARTDPGHLHRGHDLWNISLKFACEGQPRVTT